MLFNNQRYNRNDLQDVRDETKKETSDAYQKKKIALEKLNKAKRTGNHTEIKRLKVLRDKC
jgi:hypothetical protein